MSRDEDILLSAARLTDRTDLYREWAQGYREQLARDGWSPTEAEHIAGDALIVLFRKAMT